MLLITKCATAVRITTRTFVFFKLVSVPLLIRKLLGLQQSEQSDIHPHLEDYIISG